MELEHLVKTGPGYWGMVARKENIRDELAMELIREVVGMVRDIVQIELRH